MNLLEDEPDAVICVLDAYNLESSLYLLLHVLSRGLPTLAVLNRCDLAKTKGYDVNVQLLEKELRIPVVPTVAVTGEGLERVSDEAKKILIPQEIEEHERGKYLEVSWEKAEELTERVLTTDSTEDAVGKLELSLIRPWPGLAIAVLIVACTFGLVIGLGMGLRQLILLPLINGVIIPRIVSGVEAVLSPSLFKNVLIGEYGFLIKGLEWPFALVLPYVLSFYLALTLLEDSGYMPRLGALLDGLLARIGIRGSNIIPLLLGYGCGIPGILATRTFATYIQRIIVSVMICLAVPCIAQTGAFISLFAERSIGLVVVIFLFSIMIVGTAGVVLDRVLPGSCPQVPMEIPELLTPRADSVLKKMWIRIKRFMRDGELPLIAGIGVAALLYESGLLILIGRWLAPLVTGWLRLPEEAAVPLLLGVFRRELTVLPLLAMDLTLLQLFTGAVVGLFYVPCIAIVATLSSEFGIKIGLFILFLTTTAAFVFGGLLANLGLLVFG